MSDVALTVLLPVYDGEKYVGKTIESVLSQSYSDFEFLIIDDGSQDGTPRILAEYASRDSRIRIARHTNRGVGYTLDRGIKEARGALLAEIGADDLALPGRLEKQVEFLENNPDHVLVGGYLQIIDSTDRTVGIRRYAVEDRRLRAQLAALNPFASPSIMYRRAQAVACGSYTDRFSTCEDYDFILRLAQFGKIANLPEPLTAYRLHDTSTKSTRTRSQLRDTLRIKRTAYKEYGYCENAFARAVNCAQAAMTVVPSGITYWLFRNLVVRT
jgi:glycosyltransferase involved in cell wall biosynthesis